MASMTERMIGAARLDERTIKEVEADVTATPEAMMVVVLSSIAGGIWSGGDALGALMLSFAAALSWGVWAWVIFQLGTKPLAEPQTRADWDQLLRTLGFAASPGILRVLGVVPWIGGLLGWAASAWMVVASVLAVREALDYESTGRAAAVSFIGFFVSLAFFTAVSALLAALPIGAGADAVPLG